jgi:glutathione S-transferase
LVDELRAGRARARTQGRRGRVGSDLLLGPLAGRADQRAGVGPGDCRRRRGDPRLDPHHPPPRARFPEAPLWPADPARGAELDLFLEWFNEEWKRAPNSIEEELESDDPEDAAIERWSGRMAVSLDFFEGLLTGREYLFGDQLSAADCAAFPFLKYATIRDPKDTELFHVMLDDHLRLGDDHPQLAAWIDRVDALPRAYGPTIEE